MADQQIKEIAELYGLRVYEGDSGYDGIIIESKDGAAREITTEEFVKSMLPEWRR
ncbi:hypothetical protein [Bacillus licheniformis]|uniref:hypothetical protein n=1 Tax=Bacillus licheniformis TaxID=1402 RepID=UPI002DBC4E73|nr:hypothetical protein [Bacillus licheniformis]MEC0477874.1 hypothetical protein [Bacillus licheniformis]